MMMPLLCFDSVLVWQLAICWGESGAIGSGSFQTGDQLVSRPRIAGDQHDTSLSGHAPGSFRGAAKLVERQRVCVFPDGQVLIALILEVQEIIRAERQLLFARRLQAADR